MAHRRFPAPWKVAAVLPSSVSRCLAAFSLLKPGLPDVPAEAATPMSATTSLLNSDAGDVFCQMALLAYCVPYSSSLLPTRQHQLMHGLRQKKQSHGKQLDSATAQMFDEIHAS